MSHYTISIFSVMFILFFVFLSNCINESLFEIRSFIMSSSTNKVNFSFNVQFLPLSTDVSC